MRKPSFATFKAQQIEMNAKRENCPTCGKGAYNPFRLHGTDGKIVAGCIDAFHDGKLVPISTSAEWHNRKQAKEMRAESLKRLYNVLYC
jgi:hypothetical protein